MHNLLMVFELLHLECLHAKIRSRKKLRLDRWKLLYFNAALLKNFCIILKNRKVIYRPNLEITSCISHLNLLFQNLTVKATFRW